MIDKGGSRRAKRTWKEEKVCLKAREEVNAWKLVGCIKKWDGMTIVGESCKKYLRLFLKEFHS